MNGTDQRASTIKLELDESTLIRLSQQGDQEMFARVYAAYLERIQCYVYFRVADSALAEDITSQVFLKAWKMLPAYPPGQLPFITWLYRIAHSAVLDRDGAKKTIIAFGQANHTRLIRPDKLREAAQISVKKQRQPKH